MAPGAIVTHSLCGQVMASVSASSFMNALKRLRLQAGAKGSPRTDAVRGEPFALWCKIALVISSSKCIQLLLSVLCRLP